MRTLIPILAALLILCAPAQAQTTQPDDPVISALLDAGQKYLADEDADRLMLEGETIARLQAETNLTDAKASNEVLALLNSQQDAEIQRLKAENVDLALQLAAATAPTTQPAEESPIVEFSTMGDNGIAPATVHVHCQSVIASLGVADYTTLTPTWYFDDATGKYNVLRGWNAAHVFDRPGAYGVRLQITDEFGVLRYALTKTVTVRADGRPAIYVSAAGDDARDGSSPTNAAKTWARAKALLGSRSNVRLLFRRGDTFGADVTLPVNGRHVYVGAYGAGNRPVILWRGKREGAPAIVSLSGTAEGIFVDGLAWDSIYNADTSLTGMPQCIKPRGKIVAVRDCEFRNVGYAINANGQPTGLLVQDCTSPLKTGLREYFAWVEGTDHAYLGNTVANSTRQHIIRGANYQRVLIAYNDLTNTSGGTADTSDTRKGCVVQQKGSWIWTDSNVVSEGGIGIGPLGGGDGLKDPNYQTVRTKWAVTRSNNVNGSKIEVHHGAEDCAVLDNLIRQDNNTAIVVEGYGPTYQRGVVRVRIARNTVINAGATGRAISVDMGAVGVRYLRNLHVAPNLQPGNNKTASMYVVGTDLSYFSEIAGNVHPTCPAKTSYAQGGINYVWPSWSDSRGYRTPAEWANMAPVQGDLFMDLILDAAGNPMVDVDAGARR